MEKSLFEQMGGTYKQVGDYLLPDVELPEVKPVGVWGTRHYHHLRKTKRILFSQLTISGKMNDYLADIDRQAEETPIGVWGTRHYHYLRKHFLCLPVDVGKVVVHLTADD